MSNKRRTKNNNPQYKSIVIENPTCYAAEAYRRIKICLDTLSLEKRIQVIQICSAMPGDGKTTTLLNLAYTYAESGKKVLLFDLDLRKPKIHRSFGIENQNGITGYLAGNCESVDDIIRHSKVKEVDFINAGHTPFRPNVFLSLDKLKDLIEELRKRYDIILIDQPPVLVASDCCIVSSYCDGAIFQVSQSNTDKFAAREAIKYLRQNGVNILGCVYSEVNKDTDNYTYKYKYKYNYHY